MSSCLLIIVLFRHKESLPNKRKSRCLTTTMLEPNNGKRAKEIAVCYFHNFHYFQNLYEAIV